MASSGSPHFVPVPRTTLLGLSIYLASDTASAQHHFTTITMIADHTESHTGFLSATPTTASRVDDEVEEYIQKEAHRVKVVQSFFLLLVCTRVSHSLTRPTTYL